MFRRHLGRLRKPSIIRSNFICRSTPPGVKHSCGEGGALMGELSEFWLEEDGVATVEIVLILLVLIALVLVFKTQISTVLRNILSKVSSQSNSV